MISVARLSPELLSMIFHEAAAPLTSLEGSLRPRIMAAGDVFVSPDVEETYEEVLVCLPPLSNPV